MSRRADMREVRLPSTCLCPCACVCVSVCTYLPGFVWMIRTTIIIFLCELLKVDKKTSIPYILYMHILSPLCFSVCFVSSSFSSSSSFFFQALSVALHVHSLPSHHFPNDPTHGTTALDPRPLSPHSSLPPAPFPSPV